MPFAAQCIFVPAFSEAGTAAQTPDATLTPAPDLALAWNANPAGDGVTNYKVYYGGASGGPYNASGSPASAGTATTYSLPLAGLPSPLYLRLTAVNATGESSLSVEEPHT